MYVNTCNIICLLSTGVNLWHDAVHYHYDIPLHSTQSSREIAQSKLGNENPVLFSNNHLRSLGRGQWYGISDINIDISYVDFSDFAKFWSYVYLEYGLWCLLNSHVNQLSLLALIYGGKGQKQWKSSKWKIFVLGIVLLHVKPYKNVCLCSVLQD